jgi:glycosyltransferase involved in cell wall biosynthesis
VHLLSIIIPTHNRQQFAATTARKIVKECPDAQIVISDTSDDDTLPNLLGKEMLGLDRLVYVRQPHGIDVVSHFESARTYSKGEYVLFIGDDDCVGPEIETIARWAAQQQVDAVISYRNRFIANYYWPGVRSKFYGDQYAGKLFLHPFTSRAWPLDGVRTVQEALRDLGRGLGSMPRAYHGLVARTVIDAVVAKHGALFGGVSPDIYSAILITSEARNPWCVDFPFCLPGGSAPSTSGSGAARSDTPVLWDHPHIRPFKGLKWDPLIPEFYSPYNVWAFSAKKAVDRLKDRRLVPNYARLYACGLLYGRDYGSALRDAIRAHRITFGVLRTFPAIAAELIREVAFQAKRLALRALSPRAGGHAEAIGDLPTIAEAYDAVHDRSARDGAAPLLSEH